jgi:hypothetical protein
MMKNAAIVWGVVALFSWDSAFAQQPAPKTQESHRYRTIFTVIGGAGGFAVGVFAGIVAFDDAVNSERKASMTAAASAVGGAVGGYFLGRALDKRKKKTTVTKIQYGGERNPWSAVPVNQAPESLEKARKILRMHTSPGAPSQPNPCALYRGVTQLRVTLAGPENREKVQFLDLKDSAMEVFWPVPTNIGHSFSGMSPGEVCRKEHSTDR